MKNHLITLFLLLSPSVIMAQGWPENYPGVMLQAFYWDSYNDSRWTVLEQQADELANYFSLVWVPQSGNCAGQSMGYDDVYWFSNYDSSFGNKEQLLSMISTFRQKGIATIADVVINHRKSTNGWFGYPTENYNGKTYSMTAADICSNDDNGKAQAEANRLGVTLGNKDTGEGWDGMRDLDHTSTNVQNTVKDYLSMLLSDFGYSGFRYDMVKGYSPSYTAMYNTYARPQFSVGECWDGTATIRNWIDGAKDNDGQPTSAAFDFQFRYTVRNAAHSGDWRKLNQQNDGNWPLVSNNYQQGSYNRWAVTFVENHDTERRPDAEQDPLRQDTLAANAYLLAMPGTPCVFLTHWQDCKQAIKAMIDVRHAAGIHNQSAYQTLATNYDYYSFSVDGTKGRLLAVIGTVANTYNPRDENFVRVLSGPSYTYYLHRDMNMPWADLASGTYEGAQQVMLTAVTADANAKLVYATDGSTPTSSSSSIRSGEMISIPEGSTTTLKVGLLVNGSVTNVITREYTVNKPAEDTPVMPTYVEGKVFAYFEKPSSWKNVNVWAWQNGKGGEDYLGCNWPGVGATKVGKLENGNELWQWISNSDVVPDNIIFNDGGSQTGDLTFTNGGFYNQSGLISVVTAITPVHVSPTPTHLYDLTGRRFLPNQSLPKGIYIIGGKKVIR